MIAIMNVIATLGIIYASLHNHGLSVSVVTAHCTGLDTAYKQDIGRGGRWGVVSQLQQ